MISAFRYMDTLEAFAALIMIALVGFLFTKIAGLVRKRILFWHLES